MKQKELIIRGIKLLDISLLGVYYLFGGITLSYLIDLLMPIFDEIEYDKKNTFELFIEVCINVILIVIGSYLLQIIIRHIPFPLNRLYGYDHKMTNDIKGGVILSFAIILYQVDFRKKILLLTEKIKFNY